VNVALVIVATAGFFTFAFSRLQYGFDWASVYAYRGNFLRGFGMTLVISAFSLLLSVGLGLMVGVGSRSRVLFLRYLARGYVEIIRGTPLLVQILIFFYVVANAIGVQNRYLVGVIIMALFSGAYVSEIFRAGIESVGESQLESARSLGLTKRQTYRYVILPQVVRRILPPLAGQLASLIKDSSLLSIIAVKEFTLAAREVNSATFSTLESFIPLAVGYLILTLPISLLSKRLERRFAFRE
jgi:polar amino acid transport system permease protein